MNFKELALLAEDDFMSGIEVFEEMNMPVFVAYMDFCRGYQGSTFYSKPLYKLRNTVGDDDWREMVAEFTPDPIPSWEEFVKRLNDGETFMFNEDEGATIYGKNEKDVESFHDQFLDENGITREDD